MNWLYWGVIKTFKFLFTIFYRLKVEGKHHLKKGGGLVVANHVSYLDPAAIASSMKEEIHFLARKTLFKGFFSWFFPRVNVHPVDPKMSNLQVFKDICRLINEGKKVLIFPEGTRSIDGKLQQLQTGVAFILSRTKSSFFPVYIDGMHHMWSRGRKTPKIFGRVKVVFGKPIVWEELEGRGKEKQKLAMEMLEKTFIELQKQSEQKS
ncbi:1-acyl-sn-glycerol-3-phosphate acyltransferase [Candidatus Aerophobetes bacterium]|uniref:1-acyl-sn-glycerol-3-phosphate acyltransferase n=1 Tax=Aerophobetes bacterium TaxID=2030807 RepID=A0A2A4X2W7_UNCAE|nr:MAG: 1-acyl-sn-glycerol-3-phosphate acyltransferase [Candidatus Aerophobetes bacterium]